MAPASAGLDEVGPETPHRAGDALVGVEQDEEPDAVARQSADQRPQALLVAHLRGVVVSHPVPADLDACAPEAVSREHAGGGLGLGGLDVEIDAYRVEQPGSRERVEVPAPRLEPMRANAESDHGLLPGSIGMRSVPPPCSSLPARRTGTLPANARTTRPTIMNDRTKTTVAVAVQKGSEAWDVEHSSLDSYNTTKLSVVVVCAVPR